MNLYPTACNQSECTEDDCEAVNVINYNIIYYRGKFIYVRPAQTFALDYEDINSLKLINSFE